MQIDCPVPSMREIFGLVWCCGGLVLTGRGEIAPLSCPGANRLCSASMRETFGLVWCCGGLVLVLG